MSLTPTSHSPAKVTKHYNEPSPPSRSPAKVAKHDNERLVAEPQPRQSPPPGTRRTRFTPKYA